MLKLSGFPVLAVTLCLPVAMGLIMADKPTREATTREELRAVAVAASYIAEIPKYHYALERTPGVEERWFGYMVSFPPACSYSGKSGPMVSVAKGSFHVMNATYGHAVCTPDNPGWLAEDRARRAN